jgi:hypothetical protein
VPGRSATPPQPAGGDLEGVGNDQDGKLLSPRFLLTAIGSAALLLLDALTPVGLAIWLLQVILMWVTSLWATPRQILATCILCVICTVLGYSWSPQGGIESWAGDANLVLAVGAVCAIGHTGWRRRRTEDERRKAAEALARSQEEVKVLTGLLPICASCKKIRGDSGEWEQIEAYITRHSQAQFSHGICQACMSTLYPELSGLCRKTSETAVEGMGSSPQSQGCQQEN